MTRAEFPPRSFAVLAFSVCAALAATSGLAFGDQNNVPSAATLVEALKVSHHQQRKLSLKGLQGRLLHLLEITGVLALFEKNKGVSVREVN